MASPQRRLDLVDAADHLTGGEHVVIVLAPFEGAEAEARLRIRAIEAS
jgi:hypothetical protein